MELILLLIDTRSEYPFIGTASSRHFWTIYRFEESRHRYSYREYPVLHERLRRELKLLCDDREERVFGTLL